MFTLTAATVRGAYASAFVRRPSAAMAAADRVHVAGVSVDNGFSCIRIERANDLPIVAAAAEAFRAVVGGVAAPTAGARRIASENQLFGQEKTQLFPMWALRGLNPWSAPT